ILLICAGVYWFLVGGEKLFCENLLSKIKRSVLLTAERVQGYNLSLKEAMWYRRIAGGEVQCELCPLNCILGEGERGMCGVRANIGGKLRLLTYGKPVVVATEPIEKEPFFHFMPGTKTLVVATVGCNLRCNFCQNWTISQALPESEPPIDLPPERVIEKAKAESCGAIAFACSEPVVFYEYMYETAKLAHKNGIPVILKTALFINPAPATELARFIKAVNIDIKSFNEEFYRKYCNGSLRPVLEATKIMKKEGTWVEISNLLIPGANDDKKEIEGISRWILDNLGDFTPTYFVRFVPNYKLSDRPPTSFETLENAVNIAKSTGLKYVYVVIVPGNKYEDTYCHSCGKLIIGRTGFQLDEFHIINGKCAYCGAVIPGIFNLK
ncbi:MAG: AmmeMemoRadiSam system radical SAM enzyme, partial [bacterium]